MSKTKKPAVPSPTPLRGDESEFIEEVGLYMERQGLPRMAGRILGYLMVCQPPAQSFSQIAAALGASKASISTMAQLLRSGGHVRRVAVVGERAEYLSLKSGGWEDLMARQLHELTAFRRLLQRALELTEKRNAGDPHHLADLLSLHDFLRKKLPELLTEWKKREKRT